VRNVGYGRGFEAATKNPFAWVAGRVGQSRGRRRLSVKARNVPARFIGWWQDRSVYGLRFSTRFSMMAALLAACLSAASLPAFSDDYSAAKGKIEQIESDRVPPGSRVAFTDAELNAYVQHEAPSVTDGLRQPRLELRGQGLAYGTAMIDFAKLRASQGHPPSWLMSKLLSGEHPVAVTARIHSSGGQASVEVQRVEISGIVIDGATLDFLIQHFLLPLYPNAVVGRPFPLDHHI
jgi:hypothetical protein